MADHSKARRAPVTALLIVFFWVALTAVFIVTQVAGGAAFTGFACGLSVAYAVIMWERQR